MNGDKIQQRLGLVALVAVQVEEEEEEEINTSILAEVARVVLVVPTLVDLTHSKYLKKCSQTVAGVRVVVLVGHSSFSLPAVVVVVFQVVEDLEAVVVDEHSRQ